MGRISQSMPAAGGMLRSGVGSTEWRVGMRALGAVGCGLWALGPGAVGSRLSAVGRGPWAVGYGRGQTASDQGSDVRTSDDSVLEFEV